MVLETTATVGTVAEYGHMADEPKKIAPFYLIAGEVTYESSHSRQRPTLITYIWTFGLIRSLRSTRLRIPWMILLRRGRMNCLLLLVSIRMHGMRQIEITPKRSTLKLHVATLAVELLTMTLVIRTLSPHKIVRNLYLVYL